MEDHLNIISRTISGYITDNAAFFVFPSEIEARLWAEKALEITQAGTVALERFIAWDRFKEEAVQSHVQGKKSVSAVLRRLFTEKLAEKNGEAPFFTSLIPPEFAADGTVFAEWLTSILPSLSLWKRKYAEAGHGSPDTEDADLSVLEKEYTAFLDEHGLFEPAWEKPPLRKNDGTYFIFFPEAIEDFAEYAQLLTGAPGITIVSTPCDGKMEKLYCYATVREEIKAAAARILEMHDEEKIRFSDIAVSVTNLDENEPYILREFALRNIPVEYRSGKALADYSAGRLFALMQNCAETDFSFTALKALILNNQLPWKFPELNEQLIRFGIDNNCVASWREKGALTDVWEASFVLAPRETRLAAYYRTLKKSISSICASPSFADIRNRYFAFRDRADFFDPQLFTEEANDVLGRCIEELSALILVEKEYPGITPPSPFAFYLSVLKDKKYVPQSAYTGVSIFPYRVAAATPFARHLVLGADQISATVLYRPLSFLRPDKRIRLGAEDTNASDTFFRLYLLPPADSGHSPEKPYVYVSCAEQTFSSWTAPHGNFAGFLEQAPSVPPDAFDTERLWWAGTEGTRRFPRQLFSVQKSGYDAWAAPPRTDAATSAAEREHIASLLREKLYSLKYTASGDRQKLILKVSATDLKEFFICPVQWLYGRILAVQEFSLEAHLMDETAMGNLYHEILKNLFHRIAAEDGTFRNAHIDTYKMWTNEYTDEACSQYPAFQGPLAKPLLSSQSAAVASRLRAFIETEAMYFDGYAVGPLERSFSSEKDGVLLFGKIDRVSFTPDGAPVIVDYKTNTLPERTACISDEENTLSDFQIPMYIDLYESHARGKGLTSQAGTEVETALFFSILKKDLNVITGSVVNGITGKTKPARNIVTREKYQPTIEAFYDAVKKYGSAVEQLRFVLETPVPFDTCQECTYKNICRTTFIISGKHSCHITL